MAAPSATESSVQNEYQVINNGDVLDFEAEYDEEFPPVLWSEWIMTFGGVFFQTYNIAGLSTAYAWLNTGMVEADGVMTITREGYFYTNAEFIGSTLGWGVAAVAFSILIIDATMNEKISPFTVVLVDNIFSTFCLVIALLVDQRLLSMILLAMGPCTAFAMMIIPWLIQIRYRFTGKPNAYYYLIGGLGTSLGLTFGRNKILALGMFGLQVIKCFYFMYYEPNLGPVAFRNPNNESTEYFSLLTALTETNWDQWVLAYNSNLAMNAFITGLFVQFAAPPAPGALKPLMMRCGITVFICISCTMSVGLYLDSLGKMSRNAKFHIVCQIWMFTEFISVVTYSLHRWNYDLRLFNDEWQILNIINITMFVCSPENDVLANLGQDPTINFFVGGLVSSFVVAVWITGMTLTNNDHFDQWCMHSFPLALGYLMMVAIYCRQIMGMGREGTVFSIDDDS